MPTTRVYRDQVFLCHATPAHDEVYWLETVTPDGTVRMAPLDAIEKEAEGISQSLILCGHTHVARAVRLGDGRLIVNPGSVGWPGYSRQPSVSACDRSRHARRALRDPGTGDGNWRVTFRHVPYDHEAMAALARRTAANWPALATGWIR